MEAGRELDKLVGEAMGWDVEPSSKYVGHYDDLIPIGNREFIDPQGWVINEGKEPLPWLSTNDAAALGLVPLVLEGWKESEYQGYTAKFGAWYENGQWEACFGNWRDWDWELDTWLYGTSAPTLAHAICLAILQAKGKEVY